MKEYILCAAIYYNDGKPHLHQPKNISVGYVLCGRRHHNIITLHKDLTGKNSVGALQGFISSRDKFLNREEAVIVAHNAGQLEYSHSPKILVSEDLY